MRHARLALVVVVAALAPARALRANGTPETFGADPRGAALAGTSSTMGEGWTAAHTNPAQPAMEDKAEVGWAFAVTAPFADVAQEREPDDDMYRAVLPTPVSGWMLGATIPLSFLWEDHLAVGFSGYFPSATTIHARTYDPITPYFYLYETQIDHYDISAAASIKFLDWLAAGIGMRIGAGQRGKVHVEVDPLRQRLTGQSVDTEQYPIASPTAGLIVGPLGIPGFEALRMRGAFVYKEAVFFPVVLPATVFVDGIDVEAALDIHTVANYSPRTLTAGLSADIVDQVQIGVDVQYAFWSEAPPPWVSMNTNLDGEALRQLGLEDSLDVPSPAQDRVPATSGFVDTLNVKAGIEWRLLGDALALRAGYALRPTMVPDQTTGTNLIDCTTHAIGVGAAVHVPATWLGLAKPLIFEVGDQVQIFQPRSAKKRDPTDPVGPWRATGAVNHLQVGLRYHF